MIEPVAVYGAALVFAWVLLEQLGLPIPAYPVLVVAGSLVRVASSRLALPAGPRSLPA